MKKERLKFNPPSNKGGFFVTGGNTSNHPIRSGVAAGATTAPCLNTAKVPDIFKKAIFAVGFGVNSPRQLMFAHFIRSISCGLI